MRVFKYLIPSIFSAMILLQANVAKSAIFDMTFFVDGGGTGPFFGSFDVSPFTNDAMQTFTPPGALIVGTGTLNSFDAVIDGIAFSMPDAPDFPNNPFVTFLNGSVNGLDFDARVQVGTEEVRFFAGISSSISLWTFGVFPTSLSLTALSPLQTLQSLSGTIEVTQRRVVAPIPLPAALPLFVGGLGLMGMMGWRRKGIATA